MALRLQWFSIARILSRNVEGQRLAAVHGMAVMKISADGHPL
jgi:hypothetical protein